MVARPTTTTTTTATTKLKEARTEPKLGLSSIEATFGAGNFSVIDPVAADLKIRIRAQGKARPPVEPPNRSVPSNAGNGRFKFGRQPPVDNLAQ